jgi:hypothetical protein
MRPVRTITAVGFVAALAVAGCAAQRTAVHPSAAPAPVAATPVTLAPPLTPAPPVTLATPPRAPTPTNPRLAPKPAPKPAPAPPRLYFATPQAAMRYLTVAYNQNDLVALGHVTTPVARVNLLAMRRTAVNLELTGCAAQPRGDYLCAFTHDYPPAMHVSGQGHAHFLAAPADEHGWYMTVLQDCS